MIGKRERNEQGYFKTLHGAIWKQKLKNWWKKQWKENSEVEKLHKEDTGENLLKVWQVGEIRGIETMIANVFNGWHVKWETGIKAQRMVGCKSLKSIS